MNVDAFLQAASLMMPQNSDQDKLKGRDTNLDAVTSKSPFVKNGSVLRHMPMENLAASVSQAQMVQGSQQPQTSDNQAGNNEISSTTRKKRKLLEIRPRRADFLISNGKKMNIQNTSFGNQQSTPAYEAANETSRAKAHDLQIPQIRGSIEQSELPPHSLAPSERFEQPHGAAHIQPVPANGSSLQYQQKAELIIPSSSLANGSSNVNAVVEQQNIANIQGKGEVDIVRSEKSLMSSSSSRTSSSSSSSLVSSSAPSNHTSQIPFRKSNPPTSLRLAVACEMAGKFAQPKQIPIDYSLKRIPFGNIRHEVLQETGEHVVYISIAPPGGVKYWIQLSGFSPNQTSIVPPNVSQVIPEPILMSSKNEADLDHIATQTRWQRHGKTVTDIIAAVVAQAASAGIKINPNPTFMQTAPIKQQHIQLTDVCDVCAISLSSSNDTVSTCSVCCRSVHHACYGLPFGVSTNSSWQCDSCIENQTAFGGAEIKCIFCGKADGMMKKTSDGKAWAHLLCTVYLSRAAFHSPYAAEVIGGITIDGKRTNAQSVLSHHACKDGEKCSVCNSPRGAVTACAAQDCNEVYHPRCAFDNNQLMFCEGVKGMRAHFLTFCKYHSDLAMSEARRGMVNHVRDKLRKGENIEDIPKPSLPQRNPTYLPFQGIYAQTVRITPLAKQGPDGSGVNNDNETYVSKSRKLSSGAMPREASSHSKSSTIGERTSEHRQSIHNTTSGDIVSRILLGGTSCKSSIESASQSMQRFLRRSLEEIDISTSFKDARLNKRLEEQNWHGNKIAGIFFVVDEIQGKIEARDDTYAKVNGSIVKSKRKSLAMIHHKLVPSFEESSDLSDTERQQFIRDLRMFHEIVGTTIYQPGGDIPLMKKPPKLSHEEVDLYLLMKYAVSYGGYRHILAVDGCWAKILYSLLGEADIHTIYKLQKIYEQYLLFFEAHFYPHLAAGLTPNKNYREANSPASYRNKTKRKKKSDTKTRNAKSTVRKKGIEGHALLSGFGNVSVNAGEVDPKSKAFEGSDALFKVEDKRVSFAQRTSSSDMKGKSHTEAFDGFLFTSSSSAY